MLQADLVCNMIIQQCEMTRQFSFFSSNPINLCPHHPDQQNTALLKTTAFCHAFLISCSFLDFPFLLGFLSLHTAVCHEKKRKGEQGSLASIPTVPTIKEGAKRIATSDLSALWLQPLYAEEQDSVLKSLYLYRNTPFFTF